MVEDRKAIVIAQAIDALRRGWPISISDQGEILSLLAVERADDHRLKVFDPDQTADILLSAARAAILNLANDKEAATPDQPVTLVRTPWIDCASALALADPSMDLEMPMKGPFKVKKPLLNRQPHRLWNWPEWQDYFRLSSFKKGSPSNPS